MTMYSHNLNNLRSDNSFKENEFVAESVLLNEESEDSCIDLSTVLEMAELGVSITDDIDSLNEGIIQKIKQHFTDINELKAQWSKFTKSFTVHEYLKRYINPKQEEMIKKWYNILTDDDVNYSNYKKAYRFFCNFFGVPYNKVMIESIEIKRDEEDKEKVAVVMRYSKGLAKVHIPDDVQLTHVSPTDNIDALKPTFRSKTKGKYLYPSNRVFFTVKGKVKKTNAGLEGQKLITYHPKQHYDFAYIDPTCSDFSKNNGCVYIDTDVPIPVVKEEEKSGFKKFFKENSSILVMEETYPSGAILEGIGGWARQRIFGKKDNWKTSNENIKKYTYKSNSLSEEDFEKFIEIRKILRTTEDYSVYKSAFDKLCRFCHIVPRGTIITNIILRAGSEKDKNLIFVEYCYNTKKIKLNEGQKLYHVSKVDNLSELKPFFRGKSEKGYLYDKPRIYLSVLKHMPKVMADYGSKQTIHKYEVQKDIKEAYVDPLLKNSWQGAVYIETSNAIPVKKIQ